MISRLAYARRGPFRRIAKEVLALYGVEIPAEVEIGCDFRVMHRGFGTVIHPHTTIGDGVTIFHGVTIGRADPWLPSSQAAMERIIIGDGAVLCSGAIVICKAGILTVGAGAVVGANSVVTQSIGPGEVWAGVPARQVGLRREGTR